MPKISFENVFSFIFFEIVKNRKMFDSQCLVNVTLKFHSNRSITFRDILHTVSKKPSFERNAFKVSERHFSYASLTCFFYLYIAAFILLIYLFILLIYYLFYFTYSQFLQLATKSNPLTFDSPKVIFESHDLRLYSTA